MGKDFFYDILDEERKSLLPLFSEFKDMFYLAGGTGLALQIGHRDSVDFDFFNAESFSTEKLFKDISLVFAGKEAVKYRKKKIPFQF